MRLTRREVLRFSGLGALVITFLPRVAFAARNSLQSIRTGVQPGNKTRLVIETALRPSYTLEYSENQMIVNIANMTTDDAVAAKLASDALVKSVNQIQNGDKLTLVVNLKKTIAPLNKNQIMVLEPNGDNDYRLVFDFAAGTLGKASTTQTQLTAITPAKKHVIIIDAGHGGKDPGCIGKGGTREKDVVLATAKKLKNKLDAAGFKTYMTRSNDSYLKLAERAELAEKHKGDLFISLHANANPSRSVKGFSIYTLSEKASDEEAQKLADAENAADKIDVSGFEQFSKDIRVALSSLQQHAVAEMSEEYASSCCQSLKRASVDQQPGPDVRHAPFAVLRSTVPGALIELGHLSNAKEEKLLKSSDHQNKLVNAIVKSIKNYNFEV
ncbi:MAG: N-acetylmuramoyl-L-alanine amidase [Proteobacteria bacterium]|nr:N-acetylmuramoyl-L-alanine amidase [Candidatus Enterousia scatequi]